MPKILIAENIPSLNKGEMTIFEGMLESFKPLTEIQISMLSPRSEIDTLRYKSRAKVININESWPLNGGLDCSWHTKIFVSCIIIFQHLIFVTLFKIINKHVLKFFKSPIWKEYLFADLIIIGHNGTFSIGGFLGIPYFYLLYLPIVAKILNKPIIIYGGSFAPGKDLFGFAFNLLSKFALSYVDFITFRERISHENLRSIGYGGKNIFVTADPAFLLQPVCIERINEIMKQEGIERTGKPLVGITVTRRRASMAFPEMNSHFASYKKHNEELARVIDGMIYGLGATVIFLPHCIGFGAELDDRIVARDIFELCSNKEKIKIITNEYSASELKGIIAQFDLFIGERLHSVVNAMSMCVPSIVICNSTDQRLDIIKMHGQSESIYFAENLNNESLQAKINGVWTNREEIRSALRTQIEITREKSLINGSLLKELLSRRCG